MLSVSIPGEPKGPASSRSKAPVKGGRSIAASVNGGPSTVDAPVTAKERAVRNNTSMEELDRMLENDALVLMNMKKDLEITQKAEIGKAFANLSAVQKEHDTLKRDNNLKEMTLKKLIDSYGALESIQVGSRVLTEDGQRKIQDMADQLTKNNELLDAEQRTTKILHKLHDRLLEEMMKLQVETQDLSEKFDGIKHELKISLSQRRAADYELHERESKLEKLLKTMKSREVQRKQKLSKLKEVVDEGQHSVEKIQLAVIEAQSANEGLGTRSPMMNFRTSFNLSPHHSPHHSPTSRHGKSHGNPSSRQESRNIQNRLLENVKEMLHRKETKGARDEKLHNISQELVERKESMNKNKEMLQDLMAKAVEKFECLASSRQVYREIEEKNIALQSAKRDCDDWNDRNHKLHVGIEMFRREISRLLTKITQISHPVPSKDQLLDAIHKLDDEIGKVVKQTSALLMRDSSAEDVAVASQSMQSGFSDNTKSEIQRLQEMPGYSRLQKQVFYNLMTANKGSDDVNVRVNPAVDKFADNILIPHHNRFRSTRATSPDVQDNHSGSTSDLSIHDIDITSGAGVIYQREIVERSKVKEISKLIIERDAAKFGFLHLKVAKVGEPPKKKKFTPKFIEIK